MSVKGATIDAETCNSTCTSSSKASDAIICVAGGAASCPRIGYNDSSINILRESEINEDPLTPLIGNHACVYAVANVGKPESAYLCPAEGVNPTVNCEHEETVMRGSYTRSSKTSLQGSRTGAESSCLGLSSPRALSVMSTATEEVKNDFGLPPDVRLLDEFYCSKNGVFGKMYIFSTHVCFVDMFSGDNRDITPAADIVERRHPDDPMAFSALEIVTTTAVLRYGTFISKEAAWVCLGNLISLQRIQEGRQLNSLHCQQTTDVTESVSQMKPTLSQTGMGYSLTACTQSYLETSGSLPHLYVSGPLVMSLLKFDLDYYFEFPTSFVCS